MVGTKLYPDKSRSYFFLVMYGILAAAGGIMAGRSILANQPPDSVSGFMVIFGAGMFILTLTKSRRPLVSVFPEYLELRQSRTPQYIRYQNIVGVSAPDKNRLVVKVWEGGITREITIWTRDFRKTDAGRLSEFLSQKRRK